MPELPEVETMRILLAPHCNKKIIKVKLNCERLRINFNLSFINDIQNQFFTKIIRHGKFLLFVLSNNSCLVMHAGMSGKFLITKPFETFSENKHDHIIFHFEDGTTARYNDPRRFGLAQTFASRSVALKSSLFTGIATDALSTEFTSSYLYNKIHNLKSDIKAALLNQKIVSGIGNIYASEILYLAKIHPKTKCNNLNQKNIYDVHKFIAEVLQQAIKLGGSTLKDYAQPDGKTGYFQNNFKVYGRGNLKCFNCDAKIIKISQSQRSSFLCPKEQVLKLS